MNAIKSLSIIAALAVSFAACSKKEDNKTTTPTPNPTPTDTATVGKVGFEFSHKAGSADLVMTTGNYTNAAGESFTVTSPI
jgi:predicted small lipoprotein YifL